MTSTVWFDLLRAITTSSATALPDWTVTFGPAVLGNPGDWLEVGCPDPRPTEPAVMGSASHEWRPSTGRTRDETGSINLVATSWSNDDDVAVPLGRIESLLGVISGLIRADPRWGVAGVRETGISTLTPSAYADGSQVGAELLIVISYAARLS